MNEKANFKGLAGYLGGWLVSYCVLLCLSKYEVQKIKVPVR